MVNLLLFLLLLVIPAPAEAQSFPKPPDVPAYVEIMPTYRAGTALNVVGDGSTTGGLPPATELTEVAPTTESGWGVPTAPACLTTAAGGTCGEAKFRTRVSGDVKFLYDDPIRNYGQPGQSHCHMFWGNMSTNAYSTYASLRSNARSRSFAAGGPLNGTGYWTPCLMKLNPFGDGKNYALRPKDNIIIYYTNNPFESIQITRLLLGLRYVGGYDMDAGGLNASKSTWLQGILDTANAQPGTNPNRYRICNASDCHVFANWRCVRNDGSGEQRSDVLKNADGSDPWAGKCTAGQDLWVQFQGPSCWDGRNLWSPGGYKHVVPEIYDSQIGEFICPNGWYKLPKLAFQIHYAHQGFSDYGNWVLSSDIAAGKTSTPGITMHADWFNGWDRKTLSDWLVQCIGIGNENGTPRECDGSSTNVVELITSQAAPTGRFPQTATTNPGFTTSASGMVLLPSSSNGPKDIHVHGG
jgi:hypothetical protein